MKQNGHVADFVTLFLDEMILHGMLSIVYTLSHGRNSLQEYYVIKVCNDSELLQEWSEI